MDIYTLQVPSTPHPKVLKLTTLALFKELGFYPQHDLIQTMDDLQTPISTNCLTVACKPPYETTYLWKALYQVDYVITSSRLLPKIKDFISKRLDVRHPIMKLSMDDAKNMARTDFPDTPDVGDPIHYVATTNEANIMQLIGTQEQQQYISNNPAPTPNNSEMSASESPMVSHDTSYDEVQNYNNRVDDLNPSFNAMVAASFQYHGSAIPTQEINAQGTLDDVVTYAAQPLNYSENLAIETKLPSLSALRDN
jgi:hypothetical protein